MAREPASLSGSNAGGHTPASRPGHHGRQRWLGAAVPARPLRKAALIIDDPTAMGDAWSGRKAPRESVHSADLIGAEFPGRIGEQIDRSSDRLAIGTLVEPRDLITPRPACADRRSMIKRGHGQR